MRERPLPYVTNERYKSVSRTLFQLGAALLAAAIVKIYTADVRYRTAYMDFGRLGGYMGWVACSRPAGIGKVNDHLLAYSR